MHFLFKQNIILMDRNSQIDYKVMWHQIKGPLKPFWTFGNQTNHCPITTQQNSATQHSTGLTQQFTLAIPSSNSLCAWIFSLQQSQISFSPKLDWVVNLLLNLMVYIIFPRSLGEFWNLMSHPAQFLFSGNMTAFLGIMLPQQLEIEC